MHHCFHTTEILLEIFSQFDSRRIDYQSVKTASRSLARLARTCRAFKDPALDTLWASLDSIDALIQCLPGAWTAYPLWDRDANGNILGRWPRYLEGSFGFVRPLTDDDWPIIMSYARRVRELTIRNDELHFRSIDSFLHLVNAPTAPALLFPNLRVLSWFDDRDEAFPCLDRCLSPTLSHLYITSFPNTSSWTSASVKKWILDTLANRKPYLLEFDCRNLGVEVVGPVSDLICGWTQPRVIRTIVPTVRATVHLASLSSLRELHLTIPHRWQSAEYGTLAGIGTGAGRVHFPETLDTLHICGPSFALCAQYLVSIHATPRSLSVTSWAANTAAEIHNLIKVLVAHISPHRLRSLYMRTGEPGTLDISHVISLRDIEALVAFKHLEDLDLSELCPGSINDGEIDSLASSWPNPKRFLLGTEWEWGVIPGLTLTGLQSVLEKCSKLEEASDIRASSTRT
ncbi:hypothetical protein F5I97DRAFT_7483 [Phlebopus sp. FC_14]|nr:hypothetical protein F5I97DRAFT_7483 [Phlebopus sp. FC_14]